MRRWSNRQSASRFQSFAPDVEAALTESEDARLQGVAIVEDSDSSLREEHPRQQPCLKNQGYESKSTCQHTQQNRRRWLSSFDVKAPEAGMTPGSPSVPSYSTIGRAIWLLGERGVELSLPSGAARTFDIPIKIKSGSRAVRNARKSHELFVLENGSSHIWLMMLLDGAHVSAQDLTHGRESNRFKSSLGSRLVFCSPGETHDALLVTGTPGPGAHTPWLFDLQAQTWSRLPDAPYPILSSAVTAAAATVVVAGGWSKPLGCHGHVQVLSLGPKSSWAVPVAQPIPWRRPGAGCFVDDQFICALGWMECIGQIGQPNFKLLRRNGAAQRASTSSSRLCTAPATEGAHPQEIALLPFADSFEHNGEIYATGELIVCIGRDHVQMLSRTTLSWQTLSLPRELSEDNSSSWAKHCGSWALAFLV